MKVDFSLMVDTPDSLRTALHQIRQSLGEAAAASLVAGRDQVGLAGDVWVDTRAFADLAAQGRPQEALALVRGDLLEGLDDEWVYPAREAQRDQAAELLGRLAQAAEAAGDLAGALTHARRRADVAPLSEDLQREVMRLLAASGDRAAALAVYSRLAERLRRELGIAPAAATRRLLEALRSAAAAPPDSGTVPVLPLPAALARGHRSPLVGREGALAALRNEWEAARTGARRLVLLAGEPGIGKTRLAGDFARAAFAGGATVLYGRAQEDALAPYQPLAEALHPYVAACSQAQLDAHAGTLAPDLARLVPDRTRALPAQDDTRDPAGARYRLFEAVAALLGAAARVRPLLLVLDDLHWADRSTALLVSHLAAGEPAPLMILATYRDTEIDAAPRLAELIVELRREDRLARLALEPLAEADVAGLVAAWLGPDVPPELAGVLAAETAGNPFFLEELLRHLGEAGTIDVVSLGVPEGVKEVLTERLRRLGAETRSALELAAVAGREFAFELLLAAGDLEREPLVAALDAALAAHLVREVPRQPGRYAFAHALVREAIYEALPAGRRALLHGRIAVALEASAAADAELAHHFAQAGVAAGMTERAVEYAERAGRSAMTQLAYEDAAEHYERALPLAGARERRCALLLALGEARLRAGDVPGSRESFTAAATLAIELGAAESLAQAALGRSGLGVTVLGHDPETVELLERALAALPAEQSALRARLLGRLAIEIYHASVSRRERLSADAVQLARAAGVSGPVIDALSARHVALWSPPHLQARHDLADEMVALAGRAGDRERALQGRNWRVLDQLESGDIDTAEREIGEHGRLADELRLPGYQWWTPMWQAMLAILRGRFGEGERLGAAAVEIGHRAGDRVADLFAWIQATYLTYEREAPAPPPDVPDRIAVVAVQSALRSDLPLLYAEAGRIDEARRELDELAAGDFAAVASDMNRLASLAGLARGAAALADGARAEQLYQQLLPYRSRAVLIGRGAVCLGPAELYLGIAALACARLDDAGQHLDAAAAWSEGLDARPWVAWAGASRAELLRARGDRAGAARAGTDALATAQELGMGRLAARLG